ncbi:MAG: aldo/keto reductase [Planctomycetales bacterium]|nr:aldo/keto reductase [Planctomycetales bacterium]
MTDRPDEQRRTLGRSGLQVSPVAMGCWPITGMTTLNTTVAESRATLSAAYEAGINFFDTAYCYGASGESERMIGSVLGAARGEIVIATKGGIHWDENLVRQYDASPETLARECDESLARLGTDRVDVYYLHAPDPQVSIAESAQAIGRMIEEGKALAAGASNCTLDQLKEFHAACPLTVVQPYYNMLQREIEAEVVPWCQEQNIAIACYWPLMKGLLAGKLPRDHVFDPQDGRAKYPMFHGDQWEKNQDFVDELREIADGLGKTVAQLVVNWTIHRPGITAALCGARRPEQIGETAGAMGWRMTAEQLAAVDAAIARRGQPVTRGAV